MSSRIIVHNFRCRLLDDLKCQFEYLALANREQLKLRHEIQSAETFLMVAKERLEELK